ncbi:MAG: glycosyltransferase family 4 protein [Planctomycetes bacterium]|nr:glycosyltransferase family 4 protein [Planctomycetota bacterium]
MNVLALSDSLATDDGVGVMTHAVLCAWLRSHPGLQIELWLARRHPVHAPERARGLRVRACLPPDGWAVSSAPRAWIESVRLRASCLRPRLVPDTVIAFKEAPHALVGFEIAERHRVPFVSIVHGTYGVRALALPRWRSRTRAMMRTSKATIAVSEFTRTRVLETLEVDRDAIAGRLLVVPHGCDRRYLERPLQGADDPPYAITVAACKPRKGLHLTLDALEPLAREFPDLHWRILGRTHQGSSYAVELRERIARGPLAHRVTFEGRVDDERKLRLLERARVHVFTPGVSPDGAFEGFGVPFLEAAALGIPSVGTRGSGAEEALRGDRFGRLVDANAIAVRDALRSYWSLDGTERRALALTLRARATSWTWEDVANALWEHLVGGHAP